MYLVNDKAWHSPLIILMTTRSKPIWAQCLHSAPFTPFQRSNNLCYVSSWKRILLTILFIPCCPLLVHQSSLSGKRTACYALQWTTEASIASPRRINILCHSFLTYYVMKVTYATFFLSFFLYIHVTWAWLEHDHVTSFVMRCDHEPDSLLLCLHLGPLPMISLMMTGLASCQSPLALRTLL